MLTDFVRLGRCVYKLFKFSFCFWLVYFTFIVADAQTISGTVKNIYNEPVLGTTVSVFTDDSLLTRMIVDQYGFFKVRCQTIHITLKISCLGYKDIIRHLELNANFTDLGTMLIQESLMELDEIIISEKKNLYERHYEKTIINVDGQINTAGINSADLLDKIGGVSINQQLNEISLNGNEDVLIMLNGRPIRQTGQNLLSILSTINAENILKIELIPVPTAKYESGHNGGAINIVLKKEKDVKSNGYASLNIGKGKGWKKGGNAMIYGTGDKIKINGNISYSEDKSWESISNQRINILDNQAFTSTTYLSRQPKQTNTGGQLELDYFFDEKNVIGLSSAGYINKNNTKADGQGNIKTSEISDQFSTSSVQNNKWNHWMSNIHYAYSETINFDFDYLKFRNFNPSRYVYLFDIENSYPKFTLTDNRSNVDIFVTKLDLNKDINKQLSLSVGGQYSQSKFLNSIYVADSLRNYIEANDSLSSDTRIVEKILGMYTQIKLEIDRNAYLIGGVRYENTKTAINQDDETKLRNYQVFLPSIMLEKKVSDKFRYGISFSQKITRPTFNEIIPYFSFIDPNTFFFGNSDLQYSKGNDIKLDLTHKRLLLSLQANFNKNAIVRYQPTFDQETNQQIFTSLNLKYRNTYTSIVSFPINTASWWKMENTIMVVGKDILTSMNKRLHNIYYNINSIQSFFLPRNFNIELSGFFQSKSLVGLSTASAYQRLNLVLKKKLKNGHQFAFSCSNLLNFQYSVFTTPSAVENYTTNTRYGYESRIFRFTYQLPLGDKNVKSGKTRSTASEEIKNRVQ